MAVNPEIKKKTEKIRYTEPASEVRESIADGMDLTSEEANETRKIADSTKNRQTKVETDFKALQQEYTENGNGTQTSAEITLARDGEPVLADRLDRDFGNVNAQLEQTHQEFSGKITKNELDLLSRGINVLNTNVKADGSDQTAPFQNAISIAAVKKTPMIVPYEEEPYLIEGDLVIPEGVNLIGQGAKIIVHGQLNLKGDNIIQGVHFDGRWNIKGNFIQALGNGIKVLFNTFKNLKANNPKETNVINFQDVGDALVFGNIFDGTEAHSTTGSDGSSDIISRAVRIQNGENIKVQNNIFQGMKGYKDSDYIFVRADQVSKAQYPYQGVFDGYFKELKGIEVRDNIFYQISNKSSVKLQASGVSVKNNEFIYGYNSESSGRPLSVLRAHNTNNTIFEDNVIRIQGNEILYIILGEYSKTLSLKGNKIYFDTAQKKDANAYMRPLFFMSVENLLMEDNYVEGFNIREFIRLDGCKNPKIKNNDFDYRTVDQQGTLISTTNAQSGINNTGVEFTDNTITGLLATALSIAISNVADLTFKNNNFSQVGITAAGIVLKEVTGAFIGMNNVPKSGQYALSLYSSCENIILSKNRYGSGLSIFVRIYNAAKAIKVDDNYTDSEPDTIFNVGSSGQNMAELEYKKGNKSVTGYDYGRSGSKPSISKPINYKYFDTDLNKELTWTGSLWVDAAGTIV